MCVCVCITFNQWKFTFSQCVLHFSAFFAAFTSFTVRIRVWVWLPWAIFSFCCALTYLLFSFSYFVALGGNAAGRGKLFDYLATRCCCSATAAAEVDYVIVGAQGAAGLRRRWRR